MTHREGWWGFPWITLGTIFSLKQSELSKSQESETLICGFDAEKEKLLLKGLCFIVCAPEFIIG